MTGKANLQIVSLANIMPLMIINTFNQIDVVHGVEIGEMHAFAKPTARSLHLKSPPIKRGVCWFSVACQP